MNSPQRIVLLSGPEGNHDREEEMKFKLVYDGPLRPSQRDARDGQRQPLAAHKHMIRRCFHGQLKRLWETDKFLSTHKVWRKDFLGELDGRKDGPPSSSPVPFGPGDEVREPLSDVVADMYRHNGYRFVPLVQENWHLFCDIEILFLRRDHPGSLIQAGDIDNRLKTLIDALRMPKIGTEFAGNECPRDGEDPFYVLMEDDRLVTSLAVETDTLLDPISGGENDDQRALLIISVTLKPYFTTMFNLSFA